MLIKTRITPLVVAVSLAGCADGPTSPDRLLTPPSGAAMASLPAPPTEAPVRASKNRPSLYSCMVGVQNAPQAPNRYGQFFLHFPGEAVGFHPQSGWYDFRLLREDGTLLAAARCAIPATPAATRLIERFFGKRYGLVRRTDTGGEATLMGCVSEGECALEPLVVTAEQPEDTDYTDPCDVNPFGQECTGPYGDGGGYSSGGGDGGSGGDGSGDSSDPDAATDPCNTGDPLIDSPEVQAGFDSIWAQSNYSPEAPQSERREVGGWIIQTASGYSFQQFTNVETKPCGIDLPPDGKPANAVGFVHTHPWAIGEKQTSCEPIMFAGRAFYPEYKGESSNWDDKAAEALNLPGYILDANGITKFDKSGATLARHDRCGY